MGWNDLMAEAAREGQRGAVRAYSEFMPGPRVGVLPCGEVAPDARRDGDDDGWCVTEHERTLELEPGLGHVAARLVPEVAALVEGRPSRMSHRLLAGNPAWPDELAGRAGSLPPGPVVVAMPLALSRTQDDKGRVRWTLFGSSHEGPSHAFWSSFEGGDRGREAFRGFAAFACGTGDVDPRAAGLRVLAAGADPDFPAWQDEGMPDLVASLAMDDGDPVDDVAVVVTFRPFARLPGHVRQAFCDGRLRLVPHPASLAFWHHQGYRRLAAAMTDAMQVPLLHCLDRSEATGTLRLPQAGWFVEGDPHRVRRTHRNQRVGRDADVLADDAVARHHDDPITHGLFSTDPERLGLYGKPMARNAQVWTEAFDLVLDGPRASAAGIAVAAETCRRAGRYGYRFLWPPMRAGLREVFWHRPLVARLDPGGTVATLPGLHGHVTAERNGAVPVVFEPRMLDRPGHREAATLFTPEPGHHLTWRRNVRKLCEWTDMLGGPLPPSLARRLVTASRHETLDQWLGTIGDHARDPVAAAGLARRLRTMVADVDPDPGPALTFHDTATRAFEERLWRDIGTLSAGAWHLTNNADVADVPGKLPPDAGQGRQLDAFADRLHAMHDALIERHGMAGRAVCADHVFAWETDFAFDWMGGWRRNRDGSAAERNVVVVIPGTDRGEAVVLADHYDTAYMEDVYGSDGVRAAAPGADDNHSATAALLMAANVLLPMAREGRLRRDVWLVHLTGEEFPADCLGSRALVERLAARDLVLRGPGGRAVDVSATRVAGVVVMDMVAHDNGREHSVFQIAPGVGRGSARLAVVAHGANECWNRQVAAWNAAQGRAGRGRRVGPGETIPPIAEHPVLLGEVRPEWDPHSTLYNTDGIIFSDAGVPVVLVCEDYELTREGYHDTKDTMENVDLAYGAGVVAIAIETVARAAS